MIRDITRALTPGHPNWPGDTPYALETVSSIAAGAAVNVMALHTSTHTGTHLDAPYHYDEGGVRLEGVPLARLIGPARVVRAPRLTPEAIAGVSDLPERVLFCTGQPATWETFPEDFAAVSPALVHALAERGVTLLGTDAPSVDPLTSKTLGAHRACAERGVLILEGLELSGVPEGRYELICLPLSLVGADASPVRALLRDL